MDNLIVNEQQDKTCLFCQKSFKTKRNHQNHLSICKIKKEQEHLKNSNELYSLKLKYQSILLENNTLKNDITILNKELERLQNIIANKTKSDEKNSNQINNNNNTQINIFNTTPPQSLKDLINNLEPIDFNEIKSSFEKDLSNKYIDKGIEGIARFICDVPCQNKILTTDYSRKVITYKTQEQIIVDPKGSLLINTALKQNADTIIDKTEDRYNYWKDQVRGAREDDITPHETDVENKKHTKKLLTIASRAKHNLAISPFEAINIFVMKGIENKNYNAIE